MLFRVDISTALFIYLSCSVLSVLVLWAVGGCRRKETVYKNDNEYIRHCNICDNTYVDSGQEEISRCPRCDSLVSERRPVD